MANPVFCPKCGTANLPTAQYCDQCSAPLHKLIAPGARPGFDPATPSLPPPPVSAPHADVPGVSAPSSLPLDLPVEPALPHLPAPGQGAADPNRRRRNSSSLPLIVGAVLAVGLFLGIGLMAILTGMAPRSDSATVTPLPDTAATAEAINNQATAVAAQMLALQATQAALAGTQASPTTPLSPTPEPPAATATLAAAVPTDTAVPTTPPTAPPTAASDPRALLQAFPPQIEFPAQIQRAANAEQGTVSFQCPELTGINAAVSSLTAEPVGQITDDGHEFVFHFAKLPYTVAAIALPNGTTMAAQTLSLDPAQPSTLHVDLQTGAVTRDFHWLLTASNAKYNGNPVLALADTGQTQLVEVTNTATNVYQIRLATTWQAPLALDSWTVDGREVAGGQCTLTMHFDSTYMLDYNK